MKGIRISLTKSLHDIKMSFDFLHQCVFQACSADRSFSFPMHEIYQTMLKNYENKTPLQFFAIHDKQVIGCVVGEQRGSHELLVQAIAVDSKFRGMGIAKTLIEKLSKHAKKLGLRHYKVNGDIINPGFFVKVGFTPYLYIKAVRTTTIADIEEANAEQLAQIEQSPYENVVKYVIPNTNKKLLEPFKLKLNDFQAKFTYERSI